MPALPALSTVEGSRAEGNNEHFSNEPNFKNAQINLTTVPRKDYIKNDAFAPQKNEPNTNPIVSTGLSIDQFEQKMQNEPNFKNEKINVRSFLIRYYANFHPLGHRKNEPNSNPAKQLRFLFFEEPIYYFDGGVGLETF